MSIVRVYSPTAWVRPLFLYKIVRNWDGQIFRCSQQMFLSTAVTIPQAPGNRKEGQPLVNRYGLRNNMLYSQELPFLQLWGYGHAIFHLSGTLISIMIKNVQIFKGSRQYCAKVCENVFIKRLSSPLCSWAWNDIRVGLAESLSLVMKAPYFMLTSSRHQPASHL